MLDTIDDLRAQVNECEDASGLFGVAHSLINEIEALRTELAEIRPARAIPPDIKRLLLLASAVRGNANEAQDAAAAGNANGAMQRAKAVEQLADRMIAVLEGREEET